MQWQDQIRAVWSRSSVHRLSQGIHVTGNCDSVLAGVDEMHHIILTLGQHSMFSADSWCLSKFHGLHMSDLSLSAVFHIGWFSIFRTRWRDCLPGPKGGRATSYKQQQGSDNQTVGHQVSVILDHCGNHLTMNHIQSSWSSKTCFRKFSSSSAIRQGRREVSRQRWDYRWERSMSSALS